MKKYIAILMTAILMTGCAADVETSTPATESTENTTVITTTTVEVEENTPTDTEVEDNNSDTEAENNNSTPATTETEDTSSTTTTEAETEDNTSTPVDTTVTTTVTEESNPVDTEDATPTDNEGTVTEEKPVVTTTTAATTKPVTEDKPVEEKPAVTTKPTTTTTEEKKTETKPTIKSELHPEIENINLPKMNDLLNYNVKPISEISAKELGLVDDGGVAVAPMLDNLTDSYLLTDSPFNKDKNLDAYYNEKLVVGTDIPEGLYYVTYNSYTGQQSTYFKHTNKNGKEQDKIYLYAPNYREIYGFDEWNFYIYASKGDVIKGSGLALLPAPNFNCTENFYGCRNRNYYVSEKNGGIKPGTYTIKVDKEGIDETLSYVSFWRGRGMYGVYTMDKNGDFVYVTTETYMQGGYEMDGALVDGTITITLEEGQLIEMRDLDIEFVS